MAVTPQGSPASVQREPHWRGGCIAQQRATWGPSVVTQRVAGLDLDLGSAGVQDPGSLVPYGPATFSLHLQGTPPLRPWRFWGPLCTPTGKKTQRSCLWFTPLVTPLHPKRRREALGQVVRLLERPKAFPRRWPEKQATVPMF